MTAPLARERAHEETVGMKRTRKQAIPTPDDLFTQLVRKQITLDQWAAAMDEFHPITAITQVGEFEWKPVAATEIQIAA